MTLLEKMQEKFPGMSAEEIIRKACPDEVQLEGTSPCVQQSFSTAPGMPSVSSLVKQ